jgi:protease-4
MKKFLIGLVTGLVLAAVTLVILFFALVRFGERRPTIYSDSALVLSLQGEIPEQPPVQIPIPLIEAQAPATVYEIWDLLRKAAADSRVRAIVFEPSRVEAGWGKLQEIHDSLLRFKKSGKPLVAFLRNPSGRDYYLATAADHIYMTREDLLDLKGLRAELVFMRDTLNKVGVQVEVEYAGKYKDAADMFTRTSMTPETREVMNSLLDGIYGNLLEVIAASRKRTVDQVRAIIDDGPFLAPQAIEKGLVDSLLYEDEVFTEVKKLAGRQELHRLSHRDYLKVPASSLGIEGRDRIALLVGEGTILRGGHDGLGEEGAIWSASFIRLLRQVARDDQIKGVILRVDSPGGDAIASDEILREAKLLSKKKPLVISMSDLAASGGYYISMTGDPVLAYPNTLTGSIGVLYGKVNLRGLYDKLGVDKQVLTRGRFADIDSDYHPLSEQARRKLREGVDAVYRDFVQVVAEGRRRQPDEIQPFAQGRVWLGTQAQSHDLIDELGGLDRAIDAVKRRAGIAPSEKIKIVVYPPKRSLLDYLFGRRGDSLIETRLRTLLGGFDLRAWQPGGILKLMPYTIQIR